jgi:hypothetical protein
LGRATELANFDLRQINPRIHADRAIVAKLNEKPLSCVYGFPTVSRYRIDSMVEREGVEPSTPAL